MNAPTIDVILPGYTVSTSEGSLGFCAVTLVRASKTILVDVCHNGRRALLLQRLRERGLRPSDIETIVLTHAHWDHCLNIDLFPHAEVIVHENELRYAHAPDPRDWATAGYTGLILERHKLRTARDGDELDAGVRVVDVPGHTPGSIALLVEQDGGTAAITGDALTSARSALQGVPHLVFFDLAVAKESIVRLRRSARYFYPGHDRPFRLDGDSVTYLAPTSLRVTALLEPWGSNVAVTLAPEPAPDTWVMQDQPRE